MLQEVGGGLAVGDLEIVVRELARCGLRAELRPLDLPVDILDLEPRLGRLELPVVRSPLETGERCREPGVRVEHAGDGAHRAREALERVTYVLATECRAQ